MNSDVRCQVDFPPKLGKERVEKKKDKTRSKNYHTSQLRKLRELEVILFLLCTSYTAKKERERKKPLAPRANSFYRVINEVDPHINVYI